MLKGGKRITNPKTGDNIIIYIVLFAIAILGIITLIIINVKKVKIQENIKEEK